MAHKVFVGRKARAKIAIAAQPYFGKSDCSALASEIGEILAERNRRIAIRCLHIPHEPDVALSRIRIAVEADGFLQFGFFIEPGKAEGATA